MLKFSRYAVVSVLFLMTLLIFLTFNPDSYDVALQDSSAVLLKREVAVSAGGVYEQPPADDGAYDVALVTDGKVGAEVVGHVTQMLTLLKQAYQVHATAEAVGFPETIILASAAVTDAEVDQLKAHLRQGGSVIFAVLPEMTEAIRALLEIASYAPYRYVRGFEIYEGILTGGMFAAERLTLRCADVTVTGRCKVYANGLHLRYGGQDAAAQRGKTPLIWRTYYEGGAVFAFNAPFLEEETGMGLLTGVLALAQKDFLYPVVGTKSVALDHFPYFGDEAVVSSRPPLAFTRDIVWPGMLSIARSTGITLTCYASGGFLQSAEAFDTWSFMSRELQKIRGELGYAVDDPSVLEADIAFLSERLPSLVLRSFRAAMAEELPLYHATSVMANDWGGAMEWLSDQAIRLPMLSEGTGDDSADFQMQSALSLMGMVLHRVDMAPLYKGDAAWNEFSMELASYFSEALKDLNHLRAVTVSHAVEEAKNVLNTALSVRREEGRMLAAIAGNVSEVAFFLRTGRTVDVSRCENCTVTKLSEGVYWVVSPGPEFVIAYKTSAEAES